MKRRDLLGSSATLAASGCLSTESDTGSTAGPSNEQWQSVEADGSRWGLLTTPGHDGIQVDQVRTGTSWAQPTSGRSGSLDKFERPSRLVSSGHEDIYVSVEDGDDSNDGRSQSSPYQTINRALAEVPKFVYHRIHVHVDYGDYRDQRGPRLFHINQSAAGNNGLKLLGHTEENDYYDESNGPTDVVFTYGLDSGCIGSEELTVWGLTIDGVWQSYDSSIRFRNCVFRNGGLSDPERLIAGHRNRAQYLDCTFQNCAIVGYASPLCYLVFENCTAENIQNYPLRMWSSSMVFLEDSDDIVEVPPNSSKKSPGSRIVNHPDGLVQTTAGNPRSNGIHEFADRIVLEDTSEGSQKHVTLRNEGGELVVTGERGGERVL
jgi:hypothetical protein